MGIHNNFPTFGWIKLDGITVVHNGQTNIVEDFKTQLKYIYWTPDLPNEFKASNVSLNQSASRFLVAVNDKGNCVQVPNDSITVSYDGNSYEAISEKIYALYEKDDEFGDKFVAVEQDIDGIRTTVGTTQEDLNKVSEHVSQVEQKADEISLSVREFNQEYSEDKEMMALRERVVKVIVNMNAGIGLFNAKINEAFKDRNITEDEEKEIQAQITLINERRDEVVHEVDIVAGILEGMEEPQKAQQLIIAKESFLQVLQNLISLINSSISDYIIVPTEVTVVSTAFAKVSNEIRILKNTLDEMILLGAGGAISEELARINVQSNEIKLSVNKTEEQIKDESTAIREEMVSQVKDVTDALDGLEDTMNTSFLDSVLSDSEKIAIKRNIDTLLNEKTDVDKNYETVYNNPLLTGEAKDNLKVSYDNYVNKHSELIIAIEALISKEGNIEIEDQNNLTLSMNSYRTALGDFTEKANRAIDAISEGRSHIVDEKYSEILLSPDGIVNRVGEVETTTDEQGSRIDKTESSITQLADSITSKVDKDSYNSTISQLSNKISLAVTEDKLSGSQLEINPESVRIGFNNIDYASAEFNSKGLVIKRGGITTDALLPGTNRRVILEPGYSAGDNDCMSLDSNYSGIRLKRDANNYVNVLKNSIDFYVDGYYPLGSSVGTINGSRVSFNVPIYSQGSRVLTSGSYAYYGLEHNGGGNPIYGIGESNFGHKLGCQYIGNSPSGIRLKNNTNDYGGDAILELRGSTGSVGSASDICYKENIRFLPFENKQVGRRFLTAFKSEIMEDSKEGDILKFNEETYVNENFSLEELYNFIKNDMALCEYNYLNERRNSINIIAQDIADTKLGSLFTEKDEKGKLMFFINHNYLAIVVGALQYEMQKREKLEEKVTQLDTENVQLQEQVNFMEDRLTVLESKLEQLLQEK